MSLFIESLESRRLLSATATTLAGDLSAIGTDAVNAKVDFLTLEGALKADFKTISADLKGSGKSNAALLRTLKTDGVKGLAKIRAGGVALLKVAVTAKHDAAEGVKLLSMPTPSSKLSAKVNADATKLGAATATPLGKFDTDITALGTAINTDLTNITTANASNTTLATHAGKMKSDASTDGGALDTVAHTFATDIGTLSTDLLSIS